ncbi:MAG: sigma-70 family RNA polymerase sigma factor [Alphaproteobacteria bacterium]
MADLIRPIVGQIPALRRYARALTGDAPRADDLVQDCLERAWSRAHLFHRDRDIRVWLFAILHNQFVSGVRRRSRRPVEVPLKDEGHRLAVPPTQESGPEIADLGRALERLPAEQKAAVLLVGLEDMTYREAADVLGIPEGTLMSRLHRGRRRLRDLMSGDRPVRLERVK